MKLAQDLLDEISGLLNQDATNYTVFLRVYQLPMASGGSDLGVCISKAVNAGAEIDGVEAIDAVDLTAELEEQLRYAGDSGAGPSNSVLRSEELASLLMELMHGARELAAQAKAIKRFWFKVGHPAYPVFWDFAYAFFMDDRVVVLVGSSSD